MGNKRNDPCLCGSGNKYKKCCYLSENNCITKGNNNTELPPFVTCNECGGKAQQETFEIMDTQGMKGINLAIGAICGDCGAPTFAISGEPQAASELMSVMQNEMGGSVGMDAFK